MRIALVIVLGLMIGCQNTPPKPAKKESAKIKAATIHCKNKPSAETWQQFKDAGITHVVLVPKATMYNFGTTGRLADVGNSPYWSESVRGIKDAVHTAAQYNIKVIVKLHLYVDEKSNAAGKLEQIKYSQKLGDELRAIIIRYAKLCEAERIPIFVMCNETTELYRETSYWKSVIADVRRVYDGQLTVGACASRVENVAFWNELDYIGISAYYAVANKPNPDDTEMRNYWKLHKNNLDPLVQTVNKPVLFTEFGCNASEKLAMRPWEWQRNVKGEKNNYALQAAYYRTMTETFWKQPWFAGFCIWQTYSLSEFGSQGSSLGTPQGREAWKVIEALR